LRFYAANQSPLKGTPNQALHLTRRQDRFLAVHRDLMPPGR
jgi:hypothetical protein